MSQGSDKNYYELLNISLEATFEEVDAAYKEARALYGEDSVAVYSLYSPEEREAMLKSVLEAYTILKDPAKRDAYDSESNATAQKSDAPEPPQDIEGSEAKVLASAVIADDAHDVGGGNNKPFHVKSHLKVLGDSDPVASEQYRVLYTKLDRISSEGSIKVFAITSATPQEGKTVTSVNLGYIMGSEFKKKTALIECDLKRPTFLSNYLDTTPEHDFVDVINGETDLKSAMIQIEGSKLYVLPTTQPIKYSSELLNSNRLKTILGQLKAEYDFVLLDCPPIMPLADVNIISRIVDGVIMVVRSGKTPRDVVKKAVSSISGANIVGIVLNGTDSKVGQDYYY